MYCLVDLNMSYLIVNHITFRLDDHYKYQLTCSYKVVFIFVVLVLPGDRLVTLANQDGQEELPNSSPDGESSHILIQIIPTFPVYH